MKTYMTTAELAEHLSVSTAKVKEMMETGAIPEDTYFKHERTYRFHVSRVENYLLGLPTAEPEHPTEVQPELDLGDQETSHN
jgi:hypothetical protein